MSNTRSALKTPLLILSATLFMTLSCSQEQSAPPTTESLIDSRSVTELLEAMQMLVEMNPAHQTARADLAKLQGPKRDSLLEILTQPNRTSKTLNEKIDRLLALPGYQLYYKQFSNVNPDIHRNILQALPFSTIPSPAGISDYLYELLENRAAVGAWLSGVAEKVDLEKSHSIALEWLPAGEYTPPQTYLIYDGNGDAFARNGKVCFDLRGIMFNLRPKATRFQNLESMGTDAFEKIMGHEMHHIYASQYLYPKDRPRSSNWRENARDHLIRRMVSEGIAKHCDPPENLRKKTKTDTVIVSYWIAELNTKLAELSGDSLDEESYRKWLNNSYHETARNLLKQYLARTLQGAELQEQLALHASDRPSMIYTLGWWMTTQILKHDQNKTAIIELLSEPTLLFKRYNAAMVGAPSSLHIRQ